MDWLVFDEFMVTMMPIVIYWVYSGMYEALLACYPSTFDRYRLHSPKEEETKNLASKRDVVKGVLLQQAIQATITLVLAKVFDLLFG